jgi:hypothetical protein
MLRYDLPPEPDQNAIDREQGYCVDDRTQDVGRTIGLLSSARPRRLLLSADHKKRWSAPPIILRVAAGRLYDRGRAPGIERAPDKRLPQPNGFGGFEHFALTKRREKFSARAGMQPFENHLEIRDRRGGHDTGAPHNLPARVQSLDERLVGRAGAGHIGEFLHAWDYSRWY